MSKPSLHEYKGEMITVEEIRLRCYPIRPKSTVMGQLRRGMTVEEIIGTDTVKSAHEARKRGHEAQKDNKADSFNHWHND